MRMRMKHFPVKISLTSSKKIKDKKILQKKIRKFVGGWQITDNASTTNMLRKPKSHLCNTAVKWVDGKLVNKGTQKQRSRNCKQIADVTKNLLAIASAPFFNENCINDVRQNGSEGNHPKTTFLLSDHVSESEQHDQNSNELIIQPQTRRNRVLVNKQISEETNTSNAKLDEVDAGGADHQIPVEAEPHVTSKSSPRTLFGKTMPLVRHKVCSNEPVVIEMEPGSSSDIYANTQEANFDFDDTMIPFEYTDISSALMNPTTFSKEGNVCYFTQEKNFPAQKIIKGHGAFPFAFCNFQNKVIFGSQNSSTLYFKGKLSVSVLFGTLEILGYEITDKLFRKKYTVYSPRGVSLMGLQVHKQPESPVKAVRLSKKLSALGLTSFQAEKVIKLMRNMDCVAVLESFPSFMVDFLDAHFPLKLYSSVYSNVRCAIFRKAEEKLKCKFVLPGLEQKAKLFTRRPEWDDCMSAITTYVDNKGMLRIVVCGGKSVGKSTFMRFMVNQSLQRFEEVVFLDFDPGQAEFTVPGCVSAVVVKEPLLGPNHTHLTTPERMVFVGYISVADCPLHYLDCVQQVINYCRSQPELNDKPWFINTMGFSKGLGVELMVNIIRMVIPSHVIQIQSQARKRNYPEHLESAFVCGFSSTLRFCESPPSSNLDYSLHIIPSAAESESQGFNTQWGMEAHRLRTLAILSYLSEMVVPPQHCLTEIVPFMIPFHSLKLCICHQPVNYSQFLSTINGNLVALCVAGEDNVLLPSDLEYPQILAKPPVCPCLGFGIVRGIDIEKKLLFLISPLSESTLSQVNCLVMGPVFLPTSVRLDTQGIHGHIPYMSEGIGQLVGRYVRPSRAVMQRKRSLPYSMT